MADGGAVELTKDGDALIRALQKISGNDVILTSDVSVQAMMFSWSQGGWLNAHPPLQARIDALVAYGGAQSRRDNILSGVGIKLRGSHENIGSLVSAPVHLKAALAGYDGEMHFGARSDFAEMNWESGRLPDAPASFGKRITL